LDGTKVKANASKHSAVSHGRAVALLEQLENEVAELTARAERADAAKNHDCEDEPEALPEGAGVKERMAHKLAGKQGAAVYRLRKQTVEPVFGIIEELTHAACPR
jgi:phage shock protein A